MTVGETTMERDGDVVLVTIASPDARNALTPEMAAQLTEICRAVDDDRSIGALVLRGADGTFCSGADTRRWAVQPDPSSSEAYARTSAMYASFVQLGHVAVPTVAAVRGAAFGAGLNLALATDLRIVASNALLRSGFVRIGIHPGGGFLALAARLGGREAAAALGIFGQDVSGEQAAKLSIAWESVPDDAVEDRAMELAKIAASDPELIRRVVATFRAEVGPPPVPWTAAVEMDRGVQMWSQRRRQTRAAESSE
jgi:enoyl-CoA hydratase